MPRRTDLHTILLLGSGPIVIGQACEFDYSGTQACRVLRREGYRVVLVNSNPATIMTDPEFADATYIEPLDVDTVAQVIERERPDALLPTLGGQTALNLAVALHDGGVLEQFGVQLVGASIDAIHTAENREQIVRQISTERGFELIHPFDDWDVIHGQGTAAYELLQDRPDVRTIIAPVGGGGLISGTALAAKSHDPEIRIIGVEPEVAADAAASLRDGKRQSLERPPATIADGVRTMAIGQRSFEVIVEQRLVAEIVTVSEKEIEAAVVLAWERLKLALEPTGALPLAAYTKLGHPDGPAALILSGGNFDRRLIARLLSA